MKYSGDLQRKLLRLASAGNGSSGERTIRRHAGRDILTAILWELDCIVLPRRLVLVRSDGEALTLVAANRCLIEIEDSTDGRQSLAPQNEDQLLSIKVQLDGFIQGQDWVSIRVERGPKAFGERPGGVSIRLLSSAWEAAPVSADCNNPAETLGSFLQDSSDSISVWCHDTGECIECGGDTTRFDDVQGHLQELTGTLHGTGLCARKPDLEDFFLVLDSEQNGSQALVVCGFHDARAAFQTERGNVAVLADKWASVPKNAATQD